MVEEKIEAVEKISKSDKETQQLDAVDKVEGVANKDHFEALMMQQHPRQTTTAQQIDPTGNASTKKPSLMDQVADLNRKVEQVKRVQPTDIVAQAQEVMVHMTQIKDQLALSDQAIKPAYRNLLNNKLTHINENLKIALNAAGVESLPPPPNTATSNNPIDRFLGFLTHGQSQLSAIAKEVETMHLNKNNLNAASMLAVQIKVGFVQQELEFFSSVLNKALESTKTIMNVQV